MLFIGINKIQSCHGPVSGTTVTPLAVATPTDVEKKLAENVKGVIKIDTVKPKRDKKVTAKVLISQDPRCNTCAAKYIQVIDVKTYFGFTNSPKLYLGYTKDTPTVGYAHEFFRWGKTGLNLNVTFPFVGSSLTYDITDNFDLLLGGNIQYVQYNRIGEPSSYYIDTDKMKSVYPLIGAAFFF